MIRRELTAGAEALTRMLTGAGMNANEAEREKSQYLPQPHDTAESLANKVSQLRRRLEATIEQAQKGRGGEFAQETPVRTYNPETGLVE